MPARVRPADPSTDDRSRIRDLTGVQNSPQQLCSQPGSGRAELPVSGLGGGGSTSGQGQTPKQKSSFGKVSPRN